MSSYPKEKRKDHQSKLFKDYLNFLREHQQVSEATVDLRKRFVSSFLDYISNAASASKLHKLNPSIIHDYVIKTSKPLHRASKKHLVSSIRSFLRFAHIQGYLKKDLVDAVPIITIRKLENIPKGISWDSVQKLLSTPDRSTHTGRRDYAILLLLATYGVRIGQVRGLRLNDIKWHEGIIFFKASKGGKNLSLPLQKNVADALLDYIKHDRKNSSYQELFLTIRLPQRPLGSNNHLGSSLKLYYKRAKIDSVVQGARAIRHAFATKLMTNKTSIKTIADLLGHRCIDTTFIYTKIDIDQLRTLSQEWPENEQ